MGQGEAKIGRNCGDRIVCKGKKINNIIWVARR
jgi:hypothetical protein